MIPTTIGSMLQDALGLIGHAIGSIGGLFGFLFVGFLRISPLPDEVDFLLVVLFVILVIYLISRLFRGNKY